MSFNDERRYSDEGRHAVHTKAVVIAIWTEKKGEILQQKIHISDQKYAKRNVVEVEGYLPESAAMDVT